MSDTVHLALPYLAAAQAQKHVTHNEALTLLDGLVQMSVKSRALATPPGSPAEGDRYLVAASPTGDWAGQAGKFALRADGLWRFLDPQEGWTLWIDDEDHYASFTGAAWVSTLGLTAAYAAMSDGSTTATATAGDTFKFRAAAGLAATITSNDPTHGDNLLLALDVPGLTDATAADAATDLLLLHDVSSGDARKLTPRDLAFAASKTKARLGFEFFTDFIQDPSTSTSDNGLVEVNGGTGVSTAPISPGAANQVGVVQSSTGTTATGRAALATSATLLRFGGGSWFFEGAIAVPVLSNGTERFQVLLGFFDQPALLNQTDGAYFLYDEGAASTGAAASANWQCVTVNNSTRTFTTTVTAVGTGYVRLAIEVNAAGTSVAFFINGTLVATHTANIPTASGRETGFGGAIFKSAGTTARTLNYDYVLATASFTTPR